jgi:hypothetical protein
MVAAVAAAAVGEGTCSGGGRCASNLGPVLPRTMTSVRHRSGSPHWGSLTGSRSCCSSCCRMSWRSGSAGSLLMVWPLPILQKVPMLLMLLWCRSCRGHAICQRTLLITFLRC